MSIGFRFVTDSCSRERAFELWESLSQEQGYLFGCDNDHAQVGICRTGDLLLSYREGCMHGECQTNVAGPGFHAAAIELVEQFAQKSGLELQMEDETQYWQHRNFEQMRREHFEAWLNSLVDIVRKNAEENQHSSLCICWDMGQYMPQDIPGTMATPMGRFYLEQLAGRIKKEGIGAFAQDFFLWYNKGKDALFYRNNALAMLWEDCYFMPSRRSGEDERINERILALIEQAAALDAELPLPVEEYRLLCGLHEYQGVSVECWNAYNSDYPIGFRKEVVRNRLGNLTVPVPGSYLYELQGDGRDHVYFDGAEHDWHGIRISAFGTKQEQTSFNEDLFRDVQGECEIFTVGDGKCQAAYAGKFEEEDGGYHQVIAQVLSGTQVTFLTLSYEYESSFSWAMSLLRGMKASLPKENKC